jgi:hypothetical protein
MKNAVDRGAELREFQSSDQSRWRVKGAAIVWTAGAGVEFRPSRRVRFFSQVSK